MPHCYLLEKVTAAAALGAQRIRVTFADGFTADIDLAPLIDFGPVFEPLRDPRIFGIFHVRHGALEWSDDLDLSPGSLRAWCEAGRVLNLTDTDAWIQDHSRAPAGVA